MLALSFASRNFIVRRFMEEMLYVFLFYVKIKNKSKERIDFVVVVFYLGKSVWLCDLREGACGCLRFVRERAPLKSCSPLHTVTSHFSITYEPITSAGFLSSLSIIHDFNSLFLRVSRHLRH